MSFRFPWRRGKAEVLGAKAPPAHNNDSLWGSFSLLRLTGRVQLGHFCARRLGEVALTTFRLPGCGGWLDCVMLALGRLLSCPLAHTVRRGTRTAGSITQPLCSAWALCSGASAGEGGSAQVFGAGSHVLALQLRAALRSLELGTRSRSAACFLPNDGRLVAPKNSRERITPL